MSGSGVQYVPTARAIANFGLPLHPSTSALVVTASARSLPAVYPLRLDCIPFSLVTELNSVRCTLHSIICQSGIARSEFESQGCSSKRGGVRHGHLPVLMTRPP